MPLMFLIFPQGGAPLLQRVHGRPRMRGGDPVTGVGRDGGGGGKGRPQGGEGQDAQGQVLLGLGK